MTPSEVPKGDWICHFFASEEWNDALMQPFPSAFRASDRELSVFHCKKVEEMGHKLSDLCIERLCGFGEAHLTARMCIDFGSKISDQFKPNVYWRPEKVSKPWERWKDAHAQIESPGGNASFPQRYRVLLAQNADCPRLPDDVEH